jgi:hypothetical protein
MISYLSELIINIQKILKDEEVLCLAQSKDKEQENR